MTARALFEGAMLIRNDPRFSEFKLWITEQQEVALKVLTGTQEEKRMFAAQGAYNAMTSVLNLIESAPEQLEKLAR